jgi:tRNA A-37 threonylcarbamoyl transferase component Bud32
MPANAPEALCPRCLLKAAMTAPHSDGGSFTAPTPAQLAPHFPQLEILELIGQGGMGAVYKARQIKLDRFVALKILPQDPEADPAFAERFLREARALAKLQHPNIVTVHDFGEAGGMFFLLMEYVDGVNLRQLMKSGPIDAVQALRIVPIVCDALEYAHQNEVVHRDIKPENILLDRAGRVKIADFGLAKLVGRSPADFTLTGTRQAMGTPHYMAPEQMDTPLTVDHRADIYSLGVVFYELLTGQLPLGRFPPPSQKVQIDVRLDEVVLKALDRDPDRRYQSAAEVSSAVEAVRSTPGEVALPKPDAPALDPTSEWVALFGLLVGVVAVTIAIAGSRNGWIGFALLAVEGLASYVAWRPERRTLVGLILALGGFTAMLALLAADSHKWWLIFAVGFWYAARLKAYFRGSSLVDLSETLAEVPGLEDDDLAVHAALKKFKKKGLGLTLAPDIEPDAQHQIRIDCAVPPEERALALWVEPVTKRDTFAALFTNAAVYFVSEKDDKVFSTKSIPYDEFGDRTFVNHGRSVYLGEGESVTPHPELATLCQTLCDMLNAVKEVV